MFLWAESAAKLFARTSIYLCLHLSTSQKLTVRILHGKAGQESAKAE
jgi:hypothetical protein